MLRSHLDDLDLTTLTVDNGSMERVVSEAALEFDRTLQEIGAEHLSPEAGRRAALTAAADLLWKSHLGPLYTTRQVCDLMDVSRQAINERVQRGALLALSQENGDYLYPAFQFGKRGNPKKAIIEALSVFPPEVADRHTVASWFVSPQPLLDRRTPVDWVDAGESTKTLVEAAQRAAARLKQ
jgi:hypothetical protein